MRRSGMPAPSLIALTAVAQTGTDSAATALLTRWLLARRQIQKL